MSIFNRWFLGFSGDSMGKESTCKAGGFYPWVGKIPWRRAWQPTPVFLTGESQGRRSLSGHSPYGRKELDTTEVIEHTCMHAQVIFMTEGFPRGHGRHLRVKKVAQRSHGYLRFFSCWIFNNHFSKDVMSDVNISPRGNVDYWNQSWVVLMGKILMLNVHKHLKNFINSLGAASPGGDKCCKTPSPYSRCGSASFWHSPPAAQRLRGHDLQPLVCLGWHVIPSWHGPRFSCSWQLILLLTPM